MILQTIRDQVAYRRLWAPKLIMVDYTLSFEERVVAGNYARVDSDITEEHFPVERKGRWQEEVVFFYFKKLVLFDRVIVKMKNALPIGIGELLAIGKQYPEISPIVALGSVWQYAFSHSVPRNGQHVFVNDTIQAVPCLYQVGGKRELGLQRFHCSPKERQWDPGWRFPAVSGVVDAVNSLVKTPQST